MLPSDPSNVVKAVAHHPEIKGCDGGIVSGSRTMWTTSTSETIPMTISKERYGEGKELHDQRPALTPVGHGEQNMLTRLSVFRQREGFDTASQIKQDGVPKANLLAI